MNYELAHVIDKLRVRLDDLPGDELEFEDSFLEDHIMNNMEIYSLEFPITSGRQTQLIVVESMIDIITSIKVWADGESYSYKNDAIQVTRGLMSKHFQDTINLLKEERNGIILMDGGFA